LEGVIVHAGHEVLMEVDDNIVLIVGDQQGILDQQLRPHIIHLLNIIITQLTVLNYIVFNH
jgi:hypothetical protein